MATQVLGEMSLGAFKTVYQYTYDFAVVGGAQGTIPLIQNSGVLPNNFIAQNVLIDIITPLGSSGLATAALTTGQTANDLVTAGLISLTPWSTVGRKITSVLLGTIGTLLKMTADRTPALVIGVADLNAGKFNIFVEGFLSS